jgi:hypothetical protein
VAAAEPGDERATVVPEFDAEAFARDSEVRLRSVPEIGSEPTIDRARQLHRDGEHEQALFLLKHLLDLAPLHPDGSTLAAECRVALERECLVAIGSLSALLEPAVTNEELKRFTLDNVSAFLFSRLDGATDVETLLDLSGLPRLLALRHLRGLVQRGIVARGARETASRPSWAHPRTLSAFDTRRCGGQPENVNTCPHAEHTDPRAEP